MIEFNDQESAAFDEVMAVLKRYPAFDSLRFDEEKVLSLPGFEIYRDRRKIYRDRRKVYRDCREINLTTKEYNLLCLLVANRGRVLTYEQICQKVWGEEPLGNETFATIRLCFLSQLAMRYAISTVNLRLFYCFIQYNSPIDKTHLWNHSEYRQRQTRRTKNRIPVAYIPQSLRFNL